MRRSATEELVRRMGQGLKKRMPSAMWSAVKRFTTRTLFARNLRLLATVHGSDKWGGHWYAQHYEHHFRRLRRKPIVLIEIGIGGYDNPNSGGASLRMWKDYFPRGSIHGVDIHDKHPQEAHRITTHIGDQSDGDFLRGLVARTGTPDIIIDDGSHVNRDVTATFEVLFPLLATNGIYVIEDLATAYWPEFGGSSTDLISAPTSMMMLKRMVDGLNHREFLPGSQPRIFTDETVVGMHFYHNIVFCQKGWNDEAASRATASHA